MTKFIQEMEERYGKPTAEERDLLARRLTKQYPGMPTTYQNILWLKMRDGVLISLEQYE
jgi:hypothetical protein